MTMLLLLQRVLVPHGSFDLDGDGSKNELPLRACALAPDAAESWAQIADHVAISDMWRSADSSLAAVRAGRGASAPGFSGHNFGLSIDLDVERTLKLIGYNDAGVVGGAKRQLDAWLAECGWHCWRDDHDMPRWRPRPNEAWHYNFRSPDAAPMAYDGPRGNVAWLLGEIQRRHGRQLKLNAYEIQDALKHLHLYNGALDGRIGPMTREAISTFRRAWGLGDTPHASIEGRFQQTLAFVSAAVAVAPLPRRAP